MTVIYTDRENPVSFDLVKDGDVVTQNSVTRVKLTLESLSDKSLLVSYDTDSDTDIVLKNNSTAFEFKGGRQGLQVGSYTGYVTVYDAQNPMGIAWAKVHVTVVDWET